MAVDLRTSRERLVALGARARQLRLVRSWTQAELARRAAVAPRTIERFEQTGNSSLKNALRVAVALGADGVFDQLFEAPPYRSLDEALGRSSSVARKRARGRR